MKKILAVLLALLTFAGAVCAQGTATPQTYTITERTYPFYDGDINDILNEHFPLYFMNGVDDLPYVELQSCSSVNGRPIRNMT